MKSKPKFSFFFRNSIWQPLARTQTYNERSIIYQPSHRRRSGVYLKGCVIVGRSAYAAEVSCFSSIREFYSQKSSKRFPLSNEKPSNLAATRWRHRTSGLDQLLDELETFLKLYGLTVGAQLYNHFSYQLKEHTSWFLLFVERFQHHGEGFWFINSVRFASPISYLT